MERIEKVIKGLECCKWSDVGRYDGYEPLYENCEKCPYNNEQDPKSECNDKLRQDALYLLKEQEPICPDYDPVTLTWSCGNCGQTFDRCKYKFCWSCGHAVQWDKREENKNEI